MRDRYGREINYLRLSLTDRCNLRCRYCRPEVPGRLPCGELLSYEELLQVCAAAVSLGITRFKITGGEPLLRRGSVGFISRLKRLPGAEQVTLTTNGTLLKSCAGQLAEAGMDGVNISLDSCREQRYRQITGGGRLEAVLEGLQAAQDSGLKIKLNCVPLADMEQGELAGLLQLAESFNVPIRFIELMPLGCNTGLRAMDCAAIRRLLTEKGGSLVPDAAVRGNGPAVYYRLTGCGVPIGFIEPLHHKFCGGCNRVRLTAAGLLKPCLYHGDACDLKAALRGGRPGLLADKIRRAVYGKQAGHAFDKAPAAFNMNEIGG